MQKNINKIKIKKEQVGQSEWMYGPKTEWANYPGSDYTFVYSASCTNIPSYQSLTVDNFSATTDPSCYGFGGSSGFAQNSPTLSYNAETGVITCRHYLHGYGTNTEIRLQDKITIYCTYGYIEE